MGTTRPVNLLWTGGWDSTFRIVDLVVRQEIPVQPYYVIDEARRGTGHEIDAMLAIRRELVPRGLGNLLLPTRYRELASLKADPEVDAQFKRLAAKAYLGAQYRWLAVLAHEEGLHDLELTVHRDDRAFVFLANEVQLISEGERSVRALVGTPSDPDLELFRPFRFPLLDWTKPRMHAHAQTHGFADLMELTWFCHSPKRGLPCGMCGPCGYAIAEGMAHRVPLRRRLGRQVRILKRRLVSAD